MYNYCTISNTSVLRARNVRANKMNFRNVARSDNARRYLRGIRSSELYHHSLITIIQFYRVAFISYKKKCICSQ